jgi:hypothetical protein
MRGSLGLRVKPLSEISAPGSFAHRDDTLPETVDRSGMPAELPAGLVGKHASGVMPHKRGVPSWSLKQQD